MPIMTGVEFIEQARKVSSDIPVLLISGYSEQLELAPGFIQGFLAKPIKGADLRQEIQAILGKSAAADSRNA